MTVYFVSDGQYTKIGFTSGCVKSRLAQIQIGSPRKLKLVAQISGGRKLEKQIHRDYSHARTHGEWFRIHPVSAVLIANQYEKFLESTRFIPSTNYPAFFVDDAVGTADQIAEACSYWVGRNDPCCWYLCGEPRHWEKMGYLKDLAIFVSHMEYRGHDVGFGLLEEMHNAAIEVSREMEKYGESFVDMSTFEA